MSFLIYGANGYTGELIAREAVRRGMKPILAGRSQEKIGKLAAELACQSVVFDLDDHTSLVQVLSHVSAVLHCAGPFSATARSMMQGCLATHVHYFDITGEIAVFELAHSVHEKALRAGIVLCPGTGFDVVPTDCLALALKHALPDATHLALGFDSRSGLSKGTAKTTIEFVAIPLKDCLSQFGSTSPAFSRSSMSSPVESWTTSARRPAATARAWSPEAP